MTTTTEPASKRIPPPSLATKEKCLAMWERSNHTLVGLARIARCHVRTAKYWMDAWEIPYERSHRNAQNRAKNPDWSPEPEVADPASYPESPDELIEGLERWQSIVQKEDIARSEAATSLATDLPIAIAIRGDWHVGNWYTQHGVLRKHNELIAQTPGMYCIELGDFTDGQIKPSLISAQGETILPVKVQRRYVWASFKKYLLGKVLADATGCHDHWSYQQAQFDPVEWLSNDYHIPYVAHGGRIALTVGETTYTISMRHKGRGSSEYNPLHSIIKEWMRTGATDVCCHAHLHQAACMDVMFQGQLRIACRPGSYKPTDDYLSQAGYQMAVPLMPVIILWPHERRMEHVMGIENGADALRRYRTELSVLNAGR